MSVRSYLMGAALVALAVSAAGATSAAEVTFKAVNAFAERTGSSILFERFIDKVNAAMKEVARLGLAAARHLRGAVYEVRAETETRSFRVLFAQETKFILLSLHGLQKKTQKTPPREIEVAERRLKDWRDRGCS